MLAMTKRYRTKRPINFIRIQLLPGAFVEVVSPPQFDWHSLYIGITGSIVCQTVNGIYEVQFGESGAGSFLAKSLRIV